MKNITDTPPASAQVGISEDIITAFHIVCSASRPDFTWNKAEQANAEAWFLALAKLRNASHEIDDALSAAERVGTECRNEPSVLRGNGAGEIDWTQTPEMEGYDADAKLPAAIDGLWLRAAAEYLDRCATKRYIDWRKNVISRFFTVQQVMRAAADELDRIALCVSPPDVSGAINRMFLSKDATPQQIAEYDAAYVGEHAENDALMAAEKLLKSHGYDVQFHHEPTLPVKSGE